MNAARIVGVLLAAIYVGSVWFPPPPVPLVPPPWDVSLVARVFPGVPAWWAIGRLMVLMAGATLLVGASAARPLRTMRVGAAEPRMVGWAALAVMTLVQTVWAWRASVMTKPEQMAFILAIPFPVIVAMVLRRGGRHQRRAAVAWHACVVAVVVVWAVTWLPVAWRSPWIASLVDGSGVLGALVRSKQDDYNFLVDTIRPGQSAMYLVFQGGGLVDLVGFTPTMAYVQIVHAAWIAVCGLLVGWAAARLVGASTAPIAAASMLAAPFVAVETLFMGPLFIGQLLAAGLVVALVGIHERRSTLAMAAAGLCAGLMATFPSLMSLAYPGILLAVVLAMRAPRLPWPAIVVACGTFAACVVPVIPSLLAATDLYAFYNSGTAEWATMQNAFFGQLDPDFVRFQLQSAEARPFDALVGSVLAPFAAPRTGLRLWGDALFEPMSAVLAAVGLLACARRAMPATGALVAMLVLATAMGGFSSYDRASLMRLPAMPVPVALLAAAGWRVIAVRVGARGTLLAALGILASGWGVMAVVNPSILPRSATGIAIEALDAADVPRAIVLVAYGWDPQSSPTYLEALPPAPVRWMGYRDRHDFERPDGVGDATLLLWSPGVEARSGVAAAVCARWPEARLHRLTDRAGLSHVFAATTDGRDWQPRLPVAQWTASACPGAFATESTHAAAAMDEAERLGREGRHDDAIGALRHAAQAVVLQPALFDALARALLVRGTDTRAVDEAVFWARRATTVSGYCVPGPVATWLQALGRRQDAATAELVKAAQRTALATGCANLAADHPLRAGKLPPVR